jgi:long-chain acyl-CoA synthetase
MDGMNIAHWLDRAGRAAPDLPALAVGHRVKASYRTLAARAASLASGLARLGLAPGDRVAIAAQNCAEYLEMLFGVWHGGFVAVPINAKLHPAEIGWILEHSGARAAFLSEDLAGGLGGLTPAALKELIPVASPAYERLFAGDPAPLNRRAPDDLAWLFYTSGTTGRPKGAMLTHRNLVAMSLAYLTDVDPTLAGDTLLHAAPMSHGSGLYSMAHVCRMALNAVTESGGFDPEEVMRTFDRWPGVSMFAAPTMIRRLTDCAVHCDFANVRTIIWGGAPMHVADTMRALDRFGPCFAQIYGQGESPMTISFLAKADIADSTHPDWRKRLASAGIAASVIEIRIAAPGDDTDTPTAVGESGEILARGDTVMAGYWQDPEASASTLRGGWLHTGDLGFLDPDGYLTLNDRSKDLIISGGSNIYPREIEEVLLAHSGVREASVIGRPDPEWGEIAVAYVVGQASPQELDSLCLERIARFKRPKDYVFIEALPKSNYGKILKTELRRLDRERTAAPEDSA